MDSAQSTPDRDDLRRAAPRETHPLEDAEAPADARIVEVEEPVDIADLERRLRRPWEQAPAAGDDEGTPPACRALTMNLIAVAPAADESLLRASFHHLLRNQPCVAFLLLLGEEPRGLRARFSTVIEEAPDERTVLLEQVTLHAGREERRRLPSLLRPVLAHDLPTLTFWCSAMPRELRLLREITELGDSLVFDSALFADARTDLARLAELDTPATDLTQVRLKPWRQGLAEAFENVPWPPLTRVRATIRHAGNHGTRAAAVQLGNWLAERLGAEVSAEVDDGRAAPSFEADAVMIHFDDVEIRVEHCWPTPSLKVTVTLADRCLLPFTVISRCRTRGRLLAEVSAALEPSPPQGAPLHRAD